MKKEYIKYVAAEMPSFVDTVTHDDFWPKEFRFWDPKSCPTAGGAFLMSLGLISDDNAEIHRLTQATKNNSIRMIDSGGFQLGRKGTSHLKPKWVIEHQEKMGNCGFILDQIPSNVSGLKNYSDNDFEVAINKTKKYVEIMEQNRTKKDFKLYCVVHGRTLEEKQHWYDEMCKIDDFQGVAIRLEDLIQNIEFCIQNDITENIHFLGSRNLWILSLMCSASFVNGWKNVTMDSSYDRNHARIANYGEVSKRLQQNKPEFNLPWCNCPMCKALEQKYEMWDSQEKQGIINHQECEDNKYKLTNRYFLSHSMLETERTIHTFNSLVNDNEDIYHFTKYCMVQSKWDLYSELFKTVIRQETEKFVKNEEAEKMGFVNSNQRSLI